MSDAPAVPPWFPEQSGRSKAVTVPTVRPYAEGMCPTSGRMLKGEFSKLLASASHRRRLSDSRWLRYYSPSRQ